MLPMRRPLYAQGASALATSARWAGSAALVVLVALATLTAVGATRVSAATAALAPAQPTAHAPARAARHAATPAPARPAGAAARIQKLQEQLVLEPSNAHLHTQLGGLYLQEHQLEQARDEFLAAVQAAPGDPAALLNLGVCLLEMKRYGEAAQLLTACTTLAPDSARGYELLATAQAKAGDVGAARQTWERGRDRTALPLSDRVVFTQHIAQSWLDQGKLPEAADALEHDPRLLATGEARPLRAMLAFACLSMAKEAKQAGDEGQVLQACQRARAAGTTNPAAFTMPAELHLAAGRLDEADALLKEAASSLPHEAAIPFLQGRVAERRADLPAAARAYHEAAQRDASLPGVQAALGCALAQLGDDSAAAQALARAAKRGEGGAAVSFNLGIVLSRQQRWAEAIPYLNRAVESDPDLKDAYRALGTACRKADRYREAVQAYTKLLERFGPDAGDLRQLGFALAKLRRHAQASESYAKAAQLEPRDFATHYSLGQSLLELQRYDKAADAFAAASAIDPQSEIAHFSLGIAHQRAQRYADAIADYGQALQLQATYRAYINTAVCYKELGQKQSSEKYVKLAAELKKKSG
jgi:tetratricopeptide (TPR) repeat protein